MPDIDCEIATTQWRIAATRVSAAALGLYAVLAKANFNPSQPRVPPGVREGGQWTRVGDPISPTTSPSVKPSTRPDQTLQRANPTTRGPLFVTLPAPDLTEAKPLVVSRDKPTTRGRVWPEVVRSAKWLFEIVKRGTPAGRALQLLDAAAWLYEYSDDITAYLEEPKSLEELQQAATRPRRGYDKHHIVERTSALRFGIPRSLIFTPANEVGISTLRHWDLNAWMETPNADYDGLTPRQYVEKQEFAERMRVGKEALVMVRVLRL